MNLSAAAAVLGCARGFETGSGDAVVLTAARSGVLGRATGRRAAHQHFSRSPSHRERPTAGSAPYRHEHAPPERAIPNVSSPTVRSWRLTDPRMATDTSGDISLADPRTARVQQLHVVLHDHSWITRTGRPQRGGRARVTARPDRSARRYRSWARNGTWPMQLSP
jgi:hypothetical protein